MTKMFKALTIDLGASNVRVGAGRFNFSCKTSKILVPPICFPAPSDPEELKEKLGEAIKLVLVTTPEPLQALGVCAAGLIDRKRDMLVCSANQPLWKHINFVDLAWKFCPEFTRTDGCEPYHVYVENDAKSAVFAQYHLGKHPDPANIIYLTCSTGMGAGIISNDEILLGSQSLAGEVGHMIIDTSESAPLCGCGQQGCWESKVGMRNFARNSIAWLVEHDCQESWYLQARQENLPIDGKLIFTAAFDQNNYNTQAKLLLKRWVKDMAQGIGSLIVLLNPSTMVLGTVAQYWGEPLVEMIRKEVREQYTGMPTQIAHCQIKANALNNMDVLAPMAQAFEGFRHSLEWHNIEQQRPKKYRSRPITDDLDDSEE